MPKSTTNPGFLTTFRKIAVPMLKTYPSMRIWYAGCSSAKKLCRLAILLVEEGVDFERYRIYATDWDVRLLRRAQSLVQESLLKNISFFQHDPRTDRSLNEFQAIICQGTFARLDAKAKENIHRLFLDSLCPFGLIHLGKKDRETMLRGGNEFRALDKRSGLYKRIH